MLRDASIRSKVTLVLLAGCGLAIFLSGLGLAVFEWATFQRRAVSGLQSHAEMVATSVYGAVDFGNKEVATETLAALRSSKDIVAAHLFTMDGKLFASYQRDSGSPQPPVLPKDGPTFEDGDLLLVQTLSRNNEPFARLCLHSDLQTPRQHFFKSVGILVSVCLLLFLAAIWLSNLLQRAITGPVLALASTAQAVTEKKDYGLRAPKHGNDEIGRLADSFNVMLTTVQQRDESLRKNEAFLSRLIESAADAIYLCDSAGQIVRANQQARQGLGYEPDAFARMKIWEVETTLAGQEALALQFSQLANGQTLTLSGQLRRKDGTFVPVEIRLSLMETATGVFVLRFARDISERLRAETQLRQLATVVEQAAEDIVVTDLDGTIAYVNPAFESITGFTRSEVLGKNPRILKSGRQDTAFYRDLWDTVRAGKTWTGQFTNRRKDGRTVIEAGTISPIVDTHGKTVGYVSVKRDISGQVKMEEQLRHAQKMEAIGQLAGGVAHDFNNILTVIIGQVELMQTRDDLAPGLNESLLEVSTAAHRAANLTRQLLAYSRRQIMQMRALDLNEVVNNLHKMLVRLIGEHITLTCVYGSGPLGVRADVGMLEQILVNLAVNARDAMPRGGQLKITTAAAEFGPTGLSHPEARPGKFACLTVADTGQGMSEETRQRIFEPFFTTKDVGKGTGLGLATVYGIVKQHDGWLEVKSTEGRGTTFNIYFPLTTREAPTTPSASTPPVLRAGHETVLVVEDEPGVRTMVRSVLTQYGYQVLEAGNGQEALQVWSQHAAAINLLLTDMVMPEGLSGLELAHRLLAEKRGLKVICSSGYSMDLQLADPHPGIVCLPKPYQPAALVRLVRECLDQPGKGTTGPGAISGTAATG
ncbi:MAG: PAS domain S-box protein [Verrucomicrobiota bacterium]